MRAECERTRAALYAQERHLRARLQHDRSVALEAELMLVSQRIDQNFAVMGLLDLREFERFLATGPDQDVLSACRAFATTHHDRRSRAYVREFAL